MPCDRRELHFKKKKEKGGGEMGNCVDYGGKEKGRRKEES